MLTTAAALCALAANCASTAEDPAVKQKSTLSNLMSQAQVEQLADKYKATLAKGEAIDPAAYIAATNSSSLAEISTPKVESISQSEDGIVLRWKKTRAAQGYDLYRSTDGEIWEQIAQLEPAPRYYHDTEVKAGTAYSYALVATTDEQGFCNSESSTAVARTFLSSPNVTVSKKRTKASISWSRVAGATGYKIQYANNLFFVGAKSVEVDADAPLKISASGLSKDAECYVRVQTLLGEAETRQRGCWSYSANATEGKTASLRSLKTTKKVKKGKKTKKKKVVFELRRAAKQKVTGYDTLQGSCYAGGYGYYALNNRTTSKCRIAKVKLSTMKVAKVSKVLKIEHANDMTFDSKRNRLVVAHSGDDARKLSFVNPRTLKVTKTVKLSRNVSKLFDAAGAGIKSISGLSSIAYNRYRDCYVATIRGVHDMLILDANLKPMQVIALDQKSQGVYQNIEAGNDVIAVSTSANADQGANYLWCYTWTGRLLCKINLPQAMELESVFLKGSRLYAGFYLSGSKTKTKTVTTKQQVRNSSGKLVTRKVRQRVKYLAITRDNYLYKVSGI